MCASLTNFFRSVASSLSSDPKLPAATQPFYQVDPRWQMGQMLQYDATNSTKPYERQVLQWLTQGNFAALEQEAERIRAQGEKLNGGWWKLAVFYRSLSHPPDYEPLARPARWATETAWQQQQELLQEWVKQVPDSITAPITLAHHFLAWAWDVRGGGYANTVEEEMWELFSARLNEAERILGSIDGLDTACPHWHAVALNLGRGQEWDRSQIDQIFAAGEALSADYPELYYAYLSYRLPQWFGEEGEWLTAITNICQTRGEVAGAILCCQVAPELLRRRDLSEDATELVTLWPQIKAGLHLISQQYGLDAARANQGFYFALLAGDMFVARRLSQLLNGHWENDLWDDQAQYDACRNWADRFCRKHK